MGECIKTRGSRYCSADAASLEGEGRRDKERGVVVIHETIRLIKEQMETENGQEK